MGTPVASGRQFGASPNPADPTTFWVAWPSKPQPLWFPLYKHPLFVLSCSRSFGDSRASLTVSVASTDDWVEGPGIAG